VQLRILFSATVVRDLGISSGSVLQTKPEDTEVVKEVTSEAEETDPATEEDSEEIVDVEDREDEEEVVANSALVTTPRRKDREETEGKEEDFNASGTREDDVTITSWIETKKD
jgi:hypothetical protein